MVVCSLSVMTDKSSSATVPPASGTPFGDSSRSRPSSSSPFTQSNAATGGAFLRNVLPSGINPAGRLQSIRPPRDLTLGMGGRGSSRWAFAPTIPQRPRKVDDKSASMETQKSVPDESKKRGRGRGRGRGRADDKKRSGSLGRGERRDVKQSVSVFSEGPAEKTIRRQPVGFSGSRSGPKSDERDHQWPLQKSVKTENSKKETVDLADHSQDLGTLIDVMETDENAFSGPAEMVPVCLPLMNFTPSSLGHGTNSNRLTASAIQGKTVLPTGNGIIKREEAEEDESSCAIQHFPELLPRHVTATDVLSAVVNDPLLFMQFPDCICTAMETMDHDAAKGPPNSQPRTSLAAAPSGYAGKVDEP